ncbi:peptidoglycan recognition protein family protein [Rhodobacter capsulatus]|uniref:lysozyme n=1 Tax=Rhodobacter capsulatus TaxID=1061 RepID=UPI0003D308BB|nr:lysozyme [Rhodobacter capsulatus]ETD01614.1 lysozyme [Rhodobacter capsulatus DE442]ETD76681.1 lysozyme [Rhodobacter capsulatus R121]ETE53517.1 lysozyme [Rhodobacter capsulatus Y262]
MIYQGKDREPVREVILHCAAIKGGQFNGYSPFKVFSTVNRWHKERGFACFGYHGLFMPDGAFWPGRPFTAQGAHTLGHNSGTVGFLLVESAEIKDLGRFEDYFTEAQRLAVRAKIAALGGIERVRGHNDYAAKLCPGFKVHSVDWL